MAITRSDSTDRLFQSILNLKDLDECYSYFEDLCTVREIIDMSSRLDAAILLESGVSYQKIQSEMKISSATIGRVNRCLNYGTGGYREVISRLRKDGKA